MKFTKYQHLERLGTEEVDGIEVGTVYVFPKLDGTNGSVWLDAEGNLKAGSRNRTLTVDYDNAGFCRWVLENEDMFRRYLDKYPDHILYGEWLVPHSLKTYRDDAWHKFYIFDVYVPFVPTEGEMYMEALHYEAYAPNLQEAGLEYLPPLRIIKSGSDEQFRMCTEQNTYLIQEGQGIGEGVVLKNYGWVNKYGRTVWAKIVTNQFKEYHCKAMGAPILGGLSDEERIVNQFVTEHLVSKTKAKIEVERDGWHSKCIPELLGRVFHDLVTEEMWQILKEFKNPKIDFKYLNRLTVQRIKELNPEIF